MNLKKICADKTLIFDLDGTLLDTETLHFRAYNVCLSEFNVHLSDKDVQRYVGNSEKKIYKMLKSDYSIDFDEQVFFDKRKALFKSFISEQSNKLFEFFAEILKGNYGGDYYILSSQVTELIEFILKRFAIIDRFKAIYSVSDMNEKKENLLTASQKYFGATANKLVIFEDSKPILNFAKSIGITTVGITHKFNNLTKSDCDYIIDTLKE